ncbi:hypothetical protein HY17_16770 [Hyphomonas sp. CY54-11-8]|nr:hypothetical protein HY17_16770 [Hyphomonas sp. CY54-11-8]
MMRVTTRALTKRAPFHRDKNSAPDALIIEAYADLIGGDTGKKNQFALVTHNYRDFSAVNTDRRQPHPDLADLFSDEKSTYWLSLPDLLASIDEDLLPNHDLEFQGWDESRRLSEIVDAEHFLYLQVWYNRHWNRRVAIDKGKIKIVPEAEYDRTTYRADQILDSTWEGALAAAKRTEDELGEDNIGPWDDFEWGMINGKLSALRWVLGDEWDMLDT